MRYLCKEVELFIGAIAVVALIIVTTCIYFYAGKIKEQQIQQMAEMGLCKKQIAVCSSMCGSFVWTKCDSNASMDTKQ